MKFCALRAFSQNISLFVAIKTAFFATKLFDFRLIWFKKLDYRFQLFGYFAITYSLSVTVMVVFTSFKIRLCLGFLLLGLYFKIKGNLIRNISVFFKSNLIVNVNTNNLVLNFN